MTTSTPSTKLFSDSGKSCYESSRTDSGFLSGANLVSEEILSSEDLVSPKQSVSSFEVSVNKNNESCIQMDSGVDIGLNEQFSGLSLDQKFVCSDLNQDGINKHLNTSDVCKITNNNPRSNYEKLSGPNQPWELYFQQDEEGDTQLHKAIIQGFIEVVNNLIRMVPHPCFLDIPNDFVQSPLHLAVLTRQSRIIRRLVVAGASVESHDRHGNTPLHLACQMGDIDCVKSLTEPICTSEIINANLQYSGYTQQVPQDFEEKNFEDVSPFLTAKGLKVKMLTAARKGEMSGEGETCLHLAAYGGHMDVLRHLIWFGADINAREDKSGRTILHYAVETLNYKLLHFLLYECPFGPNGLIIDTPNYAGHTAYQLARILDVNIANDLVRRGAQITVDDVDEDDDHPDHNSLDDEELNETEHLHMDAGDFERTREPVHVQ